MSDLRDEIARAIAEADGGWPTRGAGVEEDREFYRASADAVLRVVGEAITGDEAVNAAWEAMDDVNATDSRDPEWTWQTKPRAALSAAWRVVTGSKDGDER